MPPRDLVPLREGGITPGEDLDPETRAVVEFLASELHRAIGVSDQRRAKSVEELATDVGGLLTRVEGLEHARSEVTIREDERRQLREEADRRLAPLRETLIKRTIDVILVLLSGGILAWIGSAAGLFK